MVPWDGVDVAMGGALPVHAFEIREPTQVARRASPSQGHPYIGTAGQVETYQGQS